MVLIYLQGGPPTQDMFDLKPDAPKASAASSSRSPRVRRASTSASCFRLTARWMHRAAVVRSVFHNGGCHKNLPMYTGFDVNLLDEEFRDTDPPSMGSVCAYLERDKPAALPPYVYLPCPLGWGEARKKAGPHGGFLGRRYDPFCTECTASVDHPPDDIWSPQVVRGEPYLSGADLPEGVTLDRSRDRRRLVDQLDGPFVSQVRRAASVIIPRHRATGVRHAHLGAVREAFDSSREDLACASDTADTLFGSARSWPGGWSSGACGSSM